MIKFSIIIRVYNTAKYLEKCLNSIFKQKFSSLEVICIDDGSNDNSIEIIKKYNNVLLLKQNNSGSGYARNEGLKIAKGEYVLFIDSDDWVNIDYLNKINNSLKNNPDVLIFGALTYDGDILRKGNYSVNKIPKKYLNKTFNKNDFKKDIFKFPPTAWTKAYKREFLIKNNIKFQNIKIGQDQIFFIKSMLLADKINVLNDNIYCYQKKRKADMPRLFRRRIQSIIIFRNVRMRIKTIHCIEQAHYLYRLTRQICCAPAAQDHDIDLADIIAQCIHPLHFHRQYGLYRCRVSARKNGNDL